jgi:pimeloyl-ACP methyl ester carboxylesterase
LSDTSAHSLSDEAPAFTFPGAQPPDRCRPVDADGVLITVYEWGAEHAPPLLLAHGGFDFARTYDVFAPLLAQAGWRVVSWDHRGHGDSGHVELYSWDADERDLLAVLDSITRDPVPAIGHSKGGGMLTHLIQALPHRFTHFVAIDGLPSRRPHPDVAEHERTRLLAEEIAGWLDHRQGCHALVRKAGTPEELAERRGRMNPRLSSEWLHYLVGAGARCDEDGWRWKIDPSLRFGGFGPWRSEWALQRLPGFPVPLLGILGTEPEPMDWGTTPKTIEPFLPPGAQLEVVKGTGHFVHIEQPEATAEIVLDFLGRPGLA